MVDRHSLSPVGPVSRPAARRLLRPGAAAAAMLVMAASQLSGGLAHAWTVIGPMVAADLAVPVDHLVISEVLTGGASASDEFVEIYNPTAQPLSIGDLELIYVTASGATITRKASWTADTAALEPGAHLLVANEAGAYATVADATYASGLAATGGSVALRAVGAANAIDAVGWGTAASTWLEGSPAPPPPAGHSLERLPGGSAGSWQDTDQNAVDFVERVVPDPQTTASDPTPAGSPAPSPSQSATPPATASPSASPTPVTTPTPTPIPSATEPPGTTTIAAARSLPDGMWVTVEGVALTDGAFSDGGGYVIDATAGIAVLVSDGSFPRGVQLRVSGEIDDRYHQRTLRTTVADLDIGDAAVEPAPVQLSTGAIGEGSEATLVRIAGEISSTLSRLTAGVALDVDDGSGLVRVVVNDASGIDTASWQRGMLIDTIGVVGQRDSSGSGTEGYRVQPRDPTDVVVIGPQPTPTATPSNDPSESGSPSPSPLPDDVVAIADARLAPVNTRLRVRGVVTLPSGVLDDGTAALQDESSGIVLRLEDEYGSLSLGEVVIVDGVRSTKSGMETIRVSSPPLRLETAAQPIANAVGTGIVGEADEAQLVLVSGSVTTAPRRTSAQNVYFDLDDGSGPVRVFVARGAGIDTSGIAAGSWLQVTGVVGQETSGQQPLRGYRVWPRVPGDITVIAAAPATGTGTDAPQATATAGSEVAMALSSTAGGWRPSLPAPRLVASPAAGAASLSGLHSTEVAASPATAAGPAADGERTPVQLALLAVMVMGAAGTAAARRPGIVERIRGAARRLAAPAAGDGPAAGVGPPSGDEIPAPHGPDGAPPFAIEDLVPVHVTHPPNSRSDRT